MTKESKDKLKRLVEGAPYIQNIYIKNDIDDVNTRPSIFITYNEMDDETCAQHFMFCTDFLVDEFDMWNSVPSITYIYRFVSDEDCIEARKGYTRVYEDGEWFIWV